MSFYTAVDLALRNSTTIRIASADVATAESALAQAKDAYIPSFILGSGLGYSYGFPLGQPSVFNVTSQSLVFNYSQFDYIRASHDAVRAAQQSLRNQREQLVLDTALDYIELDKITQQLSALRDENAVADKLIDIQSERVDVGVSARTELTRAQLIAAQVDLKRLHLERAADDLRLRLAHRTGLPPNDINTIPSSIPDAPEFPRDMTREAASSPAVKAAQANAMGKQHIAKGDSRINYHPQIAFAAQYSRFAAFNNYEDYYSRFQSNNLGIGVDIRFPLFNATNRDKAKQSRAEALRAAIEAEQANLQVQEQVQTLSRSFDELRAQARVAQLEQELSRDQLDAILLQSSSDGSSSSAPINPADAQKARIEERQKFQDWLDTGFNLRRAELSLLRMLGQVESWAKENAGPNQPQAPNAVLKP